MDSIIYATTCKTRTRLAQLSGLNTNNACIISVGCCSMQCNCAEGLHFSVFHCPVCVCVRACMCACVHVCPLELMYGLVLVDV